MRVWGLFEASRHLYCLLSSLTEHDERTRCISMKSHNSSPTHVSVHPKHPGQAVASNSLPMRAAESGRRVACHSINLCAWRLRHLSDLSPHDHAHHSRQRRLFSLCVSINVRVCLRRGVESADGALEHASRRSKSSIGAVGNLSAAILSTVVPSNCGAGTALLGHINYGTFHSPPKERAEKRAFPQMRLYLFSSSRLSGLWERARV